MESLQALTANSQFHNYPGAATSIGMSSPQSTMALTPQTSYGMLAQQQSPFSASNSTGGCSVQDAMAVFDRMIAGLTSILDRVMQGLGIGSNAGIQTQAPLQNMQAQGQSAPTASIGAQENVDSASDSSFLESIGEYLRDEDAVQGTLSTLGNIPGLGWLNNNSWISSGAGYLGDMLAWFD